MSSENKNESTLDQLAELIRTEHEAAEEEMRGSLLHAKRAGELLIEAKGRLEHGQFMGWVETNCRFSQSTANLYMKIAGEWDKLKKYQRVGISSLRRATELLVASGAEDDEKLCQDKQTLFDLRILDPADLDGLSVREVRVLVTEVLHAEQHDGYERWKETLASLDPTRAKAVKEEAGRQGRMFVDHNFLRWMARDTAIKLREGKISPTEISDRVHIEFRLRKNKPLSWKAKGPPGLAVTLIPRLISDDQSPFNQTASRFYTETMTLAREIEVGRRLSELGGEDKKIREVCRHIRTALDRLEQVAIQGVEQQQQHRQNETPAEIAEAVAAAQ